MWSIAPPVFGYSGDTAPHHVPLLTPKGFYIRSNFGDITIGYYIGELFAAGGLSFNIASSLGAAHHDNAMLLCAALLFLSSFCQSFGVCFVVRWLGGSFAKLGFNVGLCGFANVPPNALTNI